MKPTEEDWSRVRRIMALLIRHGVLLGDDGSLLQRMIRADPDRYGRVHAEEKALAVAEVNPMSRKERT